jgi:hypothetical protein
MYIFLIFSLCIVILYYCVKIICSILRAIFFSWNRSRLVSKYPQFQPNFRFERTLQKKCNQKKSPEKASFLVKFFSGVLINVYLYVWHIPPEKANLFMMSGYARDGYLMAKTTPSTDVVDNGGKHHARSWDLAAIGKAGMDDVRKVHGQVRPGTKQSHSQSRSSSFQGPTKYTHHRSKRPVVRARCSYKTMPSAWRYGGVTGCRAKTMP